MTAKLLTDLSADSVDTGERLQGHQFANFGKPLHDLSLPFYKIKANFKADEPWYLRSHKYAIDHPK